MKLDQLKTEFQALGQPDKAKSSSRFFKTGEGQYGADDMFLGITVPVVRKFLKQYPDISLSTINNLLRSRFHEERLLAVLALVRLYQEAKSDLARREIYEFYLDHLDRVNNWDLVDASARQIVGDYLLDRSTATLTRLAKSRNLWERRVAIIATWRFIEAGNPKETLRLAKALIGDPHDLIQKAVGWMLREMGKKCGRKHLTDFLDKNAAIMPRTMLRNALEHYPTKLRRHYLALG